VDKIVGNGSDISNWANETTDLCRGLAFLIDRYLVTVSGTAPLRNYGKAPRGSLNLEISRKGASLAVDHQAQMFNHGHASRNF
jgi:hypothetical protein